MARSLAALSCSWTRDLGVLSERQWCRPTRAAVAVSGVAPGSACGGGPREPWRAPHGSLLYLSRDDLMSLEIDMLEVVDAIDAACAAKGRGEVVMPPKLSLHGEGDAYSQVMAATLSGDGGLGAKWVTLFPQNVSRDLPVTNGLVVLGDPTTGVPSAVMDAATITAWRTGASVGVAARYLARADVDRVGVLGCGVQARASVRALAAVCPGIRAVVCHDAVRAAGESFVTELGRELPDVEFVRVARPAEVVVGAGIIVTAITMTAGIRPPLGPGLLEPGALAVALDYDAAWSGAAMADCDRLYCDDVSTVRATMEAGVRLTQVSDEIAGDLGDLAAGLIAGRGSSEERLFCLNLGMAVEDVVTGSLALRRARELGVGRELPL